MDLIYLNVYEVTRHYGGPEEGGWWFNHSEPLASVPMPAQRVKGCGDNCRQCNEARQNGTNGTNDFCRQLPEDWEEQLDKINSDRADARARFPKDRANYPDVGPEEFYSQFPLVYHLVPEWSDEKVEDRRKELEEMFADVNEGDIYSVLGGAKLSIRLEPHVAERTSRPRYE